MTGVQIAVDDGHALFARSRPYCSHECARDPSVQPTACKPAPGTIWVDATVPNSLQLQVGDPLLLGASTLRIARIILFEPDRAPGILAEVEADARRYIAQGFTMVGIGNDQGLLVKAADELRARFWGPQAGKTGLEREAPRMRGHVKEGVNRVTAARVRWQLVKQRDTGKRLCRVLIFPLPLRPLS